jgi:hypothetical protein
VSAGHQLLELRTVRPSLEEVFINVISQEQPEDDYVDEDVEGGDLEGGDDYEDTGEEEVEVEAASAPVRERVVTRRRGRR